MVERHGSQFSGVRKSLDGALITVHVQPNATRTEYVGPYGEALKFRVAATPIGGAANEALCRFLADLFAIPKNRVELQAGAGGRRKRILLKSVPVSQVLDRLNPHSWSKYGHGKSLGPRSCPRMQE